MSLCPYVLRPFVCALLSLLYVGFRAGVYVNEVADYLAKPGSKSEMHGSKPFITAPYASCVIMVKDWSTDR